MPRNSVPYSAGSHRTLKEPVWIGEILCEVFKPVVRYLNLGLVEDDGRPLARLRRT